MNDPRRLIDDASTGGLRQLLLRAGRDAAPSPLAKEIVLDSLLRAGPPAADGSAGIAVKSTSSAWNAAGLGKWLAVSAIGAVTATGALQTMKGGQEAPRPVPSAVTAPVALEQREILPSPVSTTASQMVLPESTSVIPVEQRTAASAAAAPSRRARTERRVRLLAARGGERVVRGDAVAPISEAQLGTAVLHSNDEPSATGTAVPRLAAAKAPAPTENEGLREELDLLDRARHALRVGDEATARLRLRAYWRRFPHGYLAPEARRLEARFGSQE